MSDRKLSSDVARCDGVATHEMSEKTDGDVPGGPLD